MVFLHNSKPPLFHSVHAVVQLVHVVDFQIDLTNVITQIIYIASFKESNVNGSARDSFQLVKWQRKCSHPFNARPKIQPKAVVFSFRFQLAKDQSKQCNFLITSLNSFPRQFAFSIRALHYQFLVDFGKQDLLWKDAPMRQ